MSYTCSVCDQVHPGPPWVWGPNAPDAWVTIDDAQRADGELGSDQCVFPEAGHGRCFVRGRLEIPVLGAEESFAWLVWVEVQPNDFHDMSKKWHQEGRENSSPYKGVLANHLAIFANETLGLPVLLHTRPVGERPFIEVADEHQLATEQKNGIAEIRIKEIAELLSH